MKAKTNATRFSALIGLTLLAAFSPPAATAAVVVTTDHNTFGYTVANSDLLQLPGATFDDSGLLLNVGESWGGNTVSNLNDGTFAIPGGNGLAIASGLLIYYLDTSVNTNGYDISAIKTYGGWPNWGRSQQQYDVAYATVDDPNSFITIAAGVDSGYYIPDVPSYTSVSIEDDTVPLLATRVSAILFTFPTQLNGGAGYRELDIIGQPNTGGADVGPSIVTQPRSVSRPVGSNVTFTVAATGTEPLYYQWRQDGTNLVGQTAASLVIDPVSYPDAGLYSVLVSNAIDTALSSGALLAVANVDVNHSTSAYAVSSSDLLQSPGVVVNSSQLSVNAAESGSFGIASLTDGLFPTSDNALAIASGVLTYTFDTTVFPMGYEVTNISTYGGWANWARSQQAYKVYYASVADPTNFVEIMSAQTDIYFDDTPSYTSISIYNTNTGVLATGVKAIRFTFPTQLNGAAGYRELDVLGSPIVDTNPVVAQIVVQPQDEVAVAGSPVTLFVLASGYPLPTYQWLFNGTNVLAGKTNATLNIPSASASDIGLYSVTVTNSLGGEISRQASLAVINVTYDHATTAFTVSSNDLLQTSLGEVDDSLLQAGPENDGFTLSSLIDGEFNVGPNGIMFSIAPGELVYSLDTSTAFRGYTISQITVCGGWANPGRADQNYSVSYSTVSDPMNFVPITTIAYSPPGSAPDYAKVEIAGVSGRALANEVQAIKLTFGPQQNGYAGYNEVDVVGAVIPVPVISIVEKTAAGAVFELMGAANQNHTLWRAPTATGVWTDIATIPMGSDGKASYTDTDAPAGSAYYRLSEP